MHAGKLDFSQFTEHLPTTTFRRCVAAYGGEHKIKSFNCLEQLLCPAFTHLTYRESLRDIEACLRAQREKPSQTSRRRSAVTHRSCHRRAASLPPRSARHG